MLDPIDTIEVIAPHFKRRLSGVTNSIIQLVPVQKKQGLSIVTIGPGLPKNLPRISWLSLLKLWKRPLHRPFRIWHARRNNEMIFGLFLRDICKMPIKVIFTSATQKKHKKFTKWLLRRMDYVIATSIKGGEYLEVPYRVIMHGINLELFYPQNKKEKIIALLPKCYHDKHIIGCFGRVRPSKGTDLFINAMCNLLPHYPDWNAIVLSNVTRPFIEFEKNLKEKVKEANLEERILFLGEKKDIANWYNSLTLYVSPSIEEGFGLTPLEAMASGVAVVTSGAGAYPQMVNENTGALAHPINLKHLITAIEPFLQNPEKTKKLGETAKNFVKSAFPIEKEAAGLKELYENLWQGRI